MADTSNLYFDYAAATPIDSRVLAAMAPYFTEQFYNPSASYLAAKRVRQAVEAARAEVAHWLGARPTEIIFTAGGTEANNLAIHGIMRQFADGHAVVSAIEHESVLEPALRYQHTLAGVKPDGRLDIENLKLAITDQTVLVSIMYANNEAGTIQPIREIAKLVTEIRGERRKAGNSRPLYLHTDACQAANYLDLHVNRLGVDLMTINAGKIYGPKQSGALFVKAGVVLEPQIVGGGQERNVRSGTEQAAGIVGFAEALKLAQTSRQSETKRLSDLQRIFMQLLSEELPQAVINGSLKFRLPNNVHITIPGQDNERLLFALDEAGVLAAAGSACNASNDEPSHVLKAMGISDADAQSSLRFTMGRYTDQAAVVRAIKTLADLTR